MHARSWGTLLSLAKLHLDVLHVVSHPLRLLLTLHQLSVELRAPLHLRGKSRQQDITQEVIVRVTGNQDFRTNYLFKKYSKVRQKKTLTT